MSRSSISKDAVRSLDLLVDPTDRPGTRYFATPAMIRKWAPLIVQAPEAFLSTLCIASPYVDMMTSSNQNLPASDSAQTLAVRHEVIRRIQESLTDPNRRIDDLTIITVLQLLTGYVISANTQTLHVHEFGLLNMIKERGGLEQLGGDGHIASSVVVYVIMCVGFTLC